MPVTAESYRFDMAGEHQASGHDNDERRRRRIQRRAQRRTAFVVFAALVGWGIVVSVAVLVQRLWPG